MPVEEGLNKYVLFYDSSQTHLYRRWRPSSSVLTSNQKNKSQMFSSILMCEVKAKNESVLIFLFLTSATIRVCFGEF